MQSKLSKYQVITEQMRAQEAQTEAAREEEIMRRLLRQSQIERRITVQLLQARREKKAIRENRTFKEKQYAERRARDFDEALDREGVRLDPFNSLIIFNSFQVFNFYLLNILGILFEQNRKFFRHIPNFFLSIGSCKASKTGLCRTNRVRERDALQAAS